MTTMDKKMAHNITCQLPPSCARQIAFRVNVAKELTKEI